MHKRVSCGLSPRFRSGILRANATTRITTQAGLGAPPVGRGDERDADDPSGLDVTGSILFPGWATNTCSVSTGSVSMSSVSMRSVSVLATSIALVVGCRTTPEPPPVERPVAATVTAAPTLPEDTVPEDEPVEADAPTPPPYAGPIDPLPSAAPALSLSARTSCFAPGDGRVFCWGGNRFGQLGDPDVERSIASRRETAAAVPGITDALTITAGAFHHCALRAEGRVSCWGHGGHGQLGEPAEDAPAPRELDLSEHGVIVELAAGRAHTCVRNERRELFCFGNDSRHQLGPSDDGVTMRGVLAVAAGGDHTCVVRDDHAVLCFGDAVDGQLSASRSGGEGRSRDPVEVLTGASDLVCGYGQCCAIKEPADDGATRSLSCWGRNDSRQLGAGPITGASAMVTDAVDHDTLVTIGLGSRHSCAIDARGRLSCAGLNHRGQLGLGGRRLRRTFTRLRRPREATLVAAGAVHSCALSGTRVMCWGANGRGQLGDGTRDHRSRPVVVRGLP